MELLAPLLTEYDPGISSEGSIDPLGLYLISNFLATKLAPGIRERQNHPRFLTAMAVSAILCTEFGERKIEENRGRR